MSSPDEPNQPADLVQQLAAARQGSRAALGRLLETYRNYLLMVANTELGADLQSKAGASDLVQETFVQAIQNFDRFQGASGKELVAWLRQILVNNLANFARHYRDTAKRRVSREVLLDGDVAGSTPGLHTGIEASPGQVLEHQEQDEALRTALDQLPEHYRLVILWRNFDCLSFLEIGQCLGRSAEAARKLWARAIDELEQRLEPHDDASGS